MMIFICYRREDSVGHTGRLFDRLVQHYGRDRVFMDLDAIEPGEDFIDSIQRRVGACEVELVIIGPSWSRAVGADGIRRLDDPEDFVRLEVQAALSRNVRVIPVLVGGANMPVAVDLPEVLRPLARRQAFELSDRGFHDGVTRLIGTLDKPPERPSATPHAEPGFPSVNDRRHDLQIPFEQALDGVETDIELPDGRRLALRVPPGIDTGQRMRLPDEGHRTGDGTVGDLYVVVTVRESRVFTRSGADLFCTMKVSANDLRQGAVVSLPRLGKRGAMKFTVPPHTKPGTRFRLAGKGVPGIQSPTDFGDLYVTVQTA